MMNNTPIIHRPQTYWERENELYALKNRIECIKGLHDYQEMPKSEKYIIKSREMNDNNFGFFQKFEREEDKKAKDLGFKNLFTNK